MERFGFGFVAVALMVGGGCMVIWPGAMIEQSRDKEEKSCSPSAAEKRRMRVVGVVLIVAGIYGLYALLSGMPGAEFFPA